MAKLTDVRDTPEIANGAKVIAVPVKGGTTIYQGALVALDASGYAIPGKKAESLTAVGRAEETVANTGADGELVIRVARGVFVFDNTATSANKITAAHVLKPCYMEDDHTVTALATGASVAGTVIRVDDEGVAVECGGYIPAAAAAVRSRPYFERVGAVSRMPMRSPVCLSAALPAMLSRYEVMSERISEGESPRSSSSLTAAQSRSSHRARRMCSVPIKLCMYFAAACAETSIILRVRGVMSEGSTVLGAPTPEVSATAENTRS